MLIECGFKLKFLIKWKNILKNGCKILGVKITPHLSDMNFCRAPLGNPHNAPRCWSVEYSICFLTTHTFAFYIAYNFIARILNITLYKIDFVCGNTKVYNLLHEINSDSIRERFFKYTKYNFN